MLSCSGEDIRQPIKNKIDTLGFLPAESGLEIPCNDTADAPLALSTYHSGLYSIFITKSSSYAHYFRCSLWGWGGRRKKKGGQREEEKLRYTGSGQHASPNRRRKDGSAKTSTSVNPYHKWSFEILFFNKTNKQHSCQLLQRSQSPRSYPIALTYLNTTVLKRSSQLLSLR